MSPERSLDKAISEEYSYGDRCTVGNHLKKGKKQSTKHHKTLNHNNPKQLSSFVYLDLNL